MNHVTLDVVIIKGTFFNDLTAKFELNFVQC